MMKRIYEIEDKVLFEPDACRLWPAADPDAAISLYAPVSQCLQLMLEHPFETLSHDYFFEEVWRKNGLYVNANTLYQNMALLRKALKSLGIGQDIIKTIPRRGIKFTGSYRLISEGASDMAEESVKEDTLPSGGNEEGIQDRENVTPGEMAGKKDREKTALYLPLITLVITAGWLFTLLTGTETADAGYFSGYYPAGLWRECTLLSSSSDKELSRQKFFMASQITGVSCLDSERAWISFNDRNRMVSVVKCDRRITQDNADCSTWIYREAEND